MTASRRPRRSRATSSPASPARRKAESGAEPGRVTLAVVTGAHGVGGEVKLKLFTDDLSPYGTFNHGALTLTALRGNIARFAEVLDRNAAEALRGASLTVARSELPPLAEGEYYDADLIGLPVATPEGESVGHVVAVENFGAGDVIEIEQVGGARLMVPMHSEAVPEWNEHRLILAPDFVP